MNKLQQLYIQTKVWLANRKIEKTNTMKRRIKAQLRVSSKLLFGLNIHRFNEGVKRYS